MAYDMTFKRYKIHGFTLIELMITLAVAAILVSLALPSFRAQLVSNKITSITNEFIGTINLARSEAIKLGKSVVICKSSDGTNCVDGGNKWDVGWILFVDSNNDNKASSGEKILKKWPKINSGYTLRSTKNLSNFIRYNSLGAANANGHFAVCNENDGLTGANAIVITNLRPKIGTDTNNNHIPESDGADIASCTLG